MSTTSVTSNIVHHVAPNHLAASQANPSPSTTAATQEQGVTLRGRPVQRRGAGCGPVRTLVADDGDHTHPTARHPRWLRVEGTG